MILTPAVEVWLGHVKQTMDWGDIPFAEAEARATRELMPIPVGRIGRIEEIAHAVCMIASPQAGYMTGAPIRIEGGQVQSIN